MFKGNIPKHLLSSSLRHHICNKALAHPSTMLHQAMSTSTPKPQEKLICKSRPRSHPTPHTTHSLTLFLSSSLHSRPRSNIQLGHHHAISSGTILAVAAAPLVAVAITLHTIPPLVQHAGTIEPRTGNRDSVDGVAAERARVVARGVSQRTRRARVRHLFELRHVAQGRRHRDQSLREPVFLVEAARASGEG